MCGEQKKKKRKKRKRRERRYLTEIAEALSCHPHLLHSLMLFVIMFFYQPPLTQYVCVLSFYFLQSLKLSACIKQNT
jgi:hypothetical protein